jgi:AraC family transcriptional regulator, exoenzyme S synthesis regulatory protein ExsA
MLVVPEMFFSTQGFHTCLRHQDAELVNYCHSTPHVVNEVLLQKHLLLFVKEGRKELTVGSETVSISAGEGALLRKGTYVMSEACCADSGHFKSVLIFVSDAFLLNFAASYLGFDRAPPPSTRIHDWTCFTQTALMKMTLSNIRVYFDLNDQVDHSLLTVKITELLLQVANTQCRQRLLQLIWQACNGTRNRGLRRFMEEHYMEPWSVEQFAEKYGISLSTFKREFCEIYGMPPKRWINRRRVEAAAIELKTTDQAIIDIGLALGFSDGAHFSKVFKQELQVSPQRYRNMSSIYKILN